jgi:multidrug transporter EmrE-like cation transporter
MFRMIFGSGVQSFAAKDTVFALALTAGNMVFNIIANASFRLAADSANWRGFLVWQVIGNLAGLITVLTLTGLLRFVPLHVAYPLTAGLAVLGVQVVAAALFFHETISSAQWLGTLLVVLGILLISGH